MLRSKELDYAACLIAPAALEASTIVDGIDCIDARRGVEL